MSQHPHPRPPTQAASPPSPLPPRSPGPPASILHPGRTKNRIAQPAPVTATRSKLRTPDGAAVSTSNLDAGPGHFPRRPELSRATSGARPLISTLFGAMRTPKRLAAAIFLVPLSSAFVDPGPGGSRPGRGWRPSSCAPDPLLSFKSESRKPKTDGLLPSPTPESSSHSPALHGPPRGVIPSRCAGDARRQFTRTPRPSAGSYP